MNIKVTKVQ